MQCTTLVHSEACTYDVTQYKGAVKNKCKITSCTTERVQQIRQLGPGIHKFRPPGRPGYYILRGGAQQYRVICMEFASRHPLGAYTFDVDHRFLKILWTPASEFSYSTGDKLYSCKSLANSDTNDVSFKLQHHF